MQTEWDNLTNSEKQPYIEKAYKLIELGYLEANDSEDLARILYNQTIINKKN